MNEISIEMSLVSSRIHTTGSANGMEGYRTFLRIYFLVTSCFSIAKVRARYMCWMKKGNIFGWKHSKRNKSLFYPSFFQPFPGKLNKWLKLQYFLNTPLLSYTQNKKNSIEETPFVFVSGTAVKRRLIPDRRNLESLEKICTMTKVIQPDAPCMASSHAPTICTNKWLFLTQ